MPYWRCGCWRGCTVHTRKRVWCTCAHMHTRAVCVPGMCPVCALCVHTYARPHLFGPLEIALVETERGCGAVIFEAPDSLDHVLCALLRLVLFLVQQVQRFRQRALLEVIHAACRVATCAREWERGAVGRGHGGRLNNNEKHYHTRPHTRVVRKAAFGSKHMDYTCMHARVLHREQDAPT